jgi:C4-type Zn-finger protein
MPNARRPDCPKCNKTMTLFSTHDDVPFTPDLPLLPSRGRVVGRTFLCTACKFPVDVMYCPEHETELMYSGSMDVESVGVAGTKATERWSTFQCPSCSHLRTIRSALTSPVPSA